MSRKQSVHAANKAKLTVSKKHGGVCDKLYARFKQFCYKPWASDELAMKQLESAAKGPVNCDPVSLCADNPALLSLFLYHFIITLRKKAGKKDDGHYVDMRYCDDKSLVYAPGTFKSVVSALIASINREIYKFCHDWKMHNGDKLAAGDVPDWVQNPPQIDIETNGQWLNVKQIRDELISKCFKLQGVVI